MLDIKKVGAKISSLRKSIGCSQEKLAELLSVTPQAISKWENGHSLPETSSLPVLAQIFGCSIDDIIMAAYSIDEKVERDKPDALAQQAEHIAKFVFAKLEEKQNKKEQIGFSDEEITEAVINKHPDITSVIINRGKTSRTMGDIRTPISISSSKRELKLLETIYHKRKDKFNSYALLKDYVNEIRTIYHIDLNKNIILNEDIADICINMYDFNEDTEDGLIIRKNYDAILRSVANWHGALWDNYKAFEQVGLPWHFETKENMLSWINNAMERPFQKYREAEESGKIPKVVDKDWFNNITEKEFDYYEEALKFLKTEYIRLVDDRYNAGNNITIIHGDLHPGYMWMFKSPDRDVLIEPHMIRVGLCTEDLAMLIALHISCDASAHTATVFNDTQPWLDYYYQCLCKKVKDYSYDTFMNDYKISVAEYLFFPIRLINNNGIRDFRMRDRAINAFKTFVLEV